MAKIIINDYEVNGHLSIKRSLIPAKNKDEEDRIIIEGILSTHLYFEDIKTISSPRYNLTGINVYSEQFGSDDYDIIYSFTAEDLEIKGIIKDGITCILYPEEMKQIEDIMYKNDHPILGNIGEEYKDIYIKEDK